MLMNHLNITNTQKKKLRIFSTSADTGKHVTNGIGGSQSENQHSKKLKEFN